MMHGIVDQNCEATIRLVVGNANSQRQVIDAVIDTGFTGFLTLPLPILTAVLKWVSHSASILLVCVSETLTLSYVAYSNENCCNSLNLQAYRREAGTLGDGSTCIFDGYRGLVIWDGEFRRIDINESETAPLVGMSLLYGYRVQLDAIEGGTVIIQSLSSLS